MTTASALLDPEPRMPKTQGHVRVLREFGQAQSDYGVSYLMDFNDNWKTLPVFKPEQYIIIPGIRGCKLRGCGVQGAVAAAVVNYAETRKAIISSNLKWQSLMANHHSTAPARPPMITRRAAARPGTSSWTPSPMHMVDDDDLYTRSGRNDESDTDSDTDSEDGDDNIEQSPQKPTKKQRDNHVLHAMLMDDASDDEEDGNARLNPRAVETTVTTTAPNVTQTQQQTVASQPTSTTHEGTEAAKPKKKFRKLRKACSAMRRACTAAVSAAFSPSSSKSDKKDK